MNKDTARSTTTEANMAKETHFRCMKCLVMLPLGALKNKHWTGRKPSGEVVRVDNFCCPECGSNDLVYRNGDAK